LLAGGESVVLAPKDRSYAEALADQLGPLARTVSVENAIAIGDAVVLALMLDTIMELIPNGQLIDPDQAGAADPAELPA
jgi:predicted dinucleotide-binding enzyme